MVRLLKWLLGYVSFKFINGFPQGFLNDCYSEKFNIQNVRIKDGALYAECPSGLYPHLRAVAKKNGGRLKIIKKHGLIFILSKIKNRWGIFVGAVVGIIFLSFISGFVWNIEIVGNSKLSEAELRSFAADYGFYEGAYWRSIDKGQVEDMLLASYEDIAWAHINRDGTSARLEINEGVLKPKTVKPKKYTNLKAKKDGIIVKTNVHSGWQVAKKGDAVTKGDLLISGVYTNEKGSSQFARASGEYIARVKEKISVTVSRNQSRKKYLSEIKRKSLRFFFIEIPLYIGNTPKNSEITAEEKMLELNEKKLPLGIVETTVRMYKNEVITLSDRELTELLNKETEKKIKEDFSDYEIIKRKIKTELKDDCAVSTGYLICHENIGKEVRLKIKRK